MNHPENSPTLKRASRLATVFVLLAGGIALCRALLVPADPDATWTPALIWLVLATPPGLLLARGLKTGSRFCAVALVALAVGGSAALAAGFRKPPGPWMVAALLNGAWPLWWLAQGTRAAFRSRRAELFPGGGIEDQLAFAQRQKLLSATPRLRKALLFARLLSVFAIPGVLLTMVLSIRDLDSLERAGGNPALVGFVLLINVGSLGLQISALWLAYGCGRRVRKLDFRGLAFAVEALGHAYLVSTLLGAVSFAVALIAVAVAGNAADFAQVVILLLALILINAVRRRIKDAEEEAASLAGEDDATPSPGSTLPLRLWPVFGRIVVGLVLFVALGAGAASFLDRMRATYREFESQPYRAEQLRLAKKPDEAMQVLSGYLARRPLTDDVRRIRAPILAALNRPEEARQDVAAVVANEPRQPDAHSFAASVYASLKDYPAAIAEMDRAIALDPRDGRSFSNRATYHDSNHDPAKAESDLRTAITLHDTDEALHRRLGWMLFHRDDRKGALSAWLAADALAQRGYRSDNAADLAAGLVVGHWTNGNVAPAVASYLKLLHLNPKFAEQETIDRLGWSQKELQPLREVRPKAVGLPAVFRERKHDYAIFLGLGLAGEGRSYYENLLAAAKPGDGKSAAGGAEFELAWLLFHLGNTAEAVTRFQAAARVAGSDDADGIMAAVAAAQWSANRRPEALATFATLFKKTPAWSSTAELASLGWLPAELAALEAVRSAFSQANDTHACLNAPYQVTLSFPWQLSSPAETPEGVDFAFGRAGFNLQVESLKETLDLEELRKLLKENTVKMDKSALMTSSEIKFSERTFRVNGMDWMELTAEGSSRRWHYFIHAEPEKNVILTVYHWWLGAPGAEETLASIPASVRPRPSSP